MFQHIINKLILITIVFFCSNVTIAQSKENITLENSNICEKAKKSAERDISNGKIKKLMLGDGRDLKLEYVLNNEFNIQTEYIGCLPSPFDICYNEKMDEVIFKKYGDKIYRKAAKKAKKLNARDIQKN